MSVAGKRVLTAPKPRLEVLLRLVEHPLFGGGCLRSGVGLRRGSALRGTQPNGTGDLLVLSTNTSGGTIGTALTNATASGSGVTIGGSGNVTLGTVLSTGRPSNTYANARRKMSNVSGFPYTGSAEFCRMLYGRMSSNPRM